MAEIATKEDPRKHPPQKPRTGSTITNPPLTPLIDIFLFLIIFFLLSCQFLQGEGTIPANLPAIGSEPTDRPVFRPDPVRVQLTALDSAGENVEVLIAGTRMGGQAGDSGTTSSMEDLFMFLSQKRSSLGGQTESLPIIIKPGPGVRWGSVVDAFNQAVRAGMKEVGVAPSLASSI